MHSAAEHCPTPTRSGRSRVKSGRSRAESGCSSVERGRSSAEAATVKRKATLQPVPTLFGHLPLYCGRCPIYCGSLPFYCGCSLIYCGRSPIYSGHSPDRFPHYCDRSLLVLDSVPQRSALMGHHTALLQPLSKLPRLLSELLRPLSALAFRTKQFCSNIDSMPIVLCLTLPYLSAVSLCCTAWWRQPKCTWITAKCFARIPSFT